MALYLDSARVEEVREGLAWGFVTGLTTNPRLIAQAGRPAPYILSFAHLAFFALALFLARAVAVWEDF